MKEGGYTAGLGFRVGCCEPLLPIKFISMLHVLLLSCFLLMSHSRTSAAEMFEGTGSGAAAYTLLELKQAILFVLNELQPPLRSRLGSQGGYTAQDLRASCISGRDIMSGGEGLWSTNEMLEAGYSMSEVNDALVTARVDVKPELSTELPSFEELRSPPHASSLDYIALQFDQKNM